MIAKIYPANHPDIVGLKKPCRYFGIRKLTEGECLKLMDVGDDDIATMVDSPRLSKSAIYKLAGNSIVVSCLYHIFHDVWLTEEKPQPMMLFPEPTFRCEMPKKFNIVTLCSGYDSQVMAMERIVYAAKKEGYDVDIDLLAWSEFDPDSKKPIEEQPAVIAHNLLFPRWANRNVGDMTKVDWDEWRRGIPSETEIDLLTYSTPCQSISQAGKREGIVKGSGTTSSILWNTEDAIRALRPKFLLQENVKALCNKVNMPYFLEWQKVCENLGYKNYWKVLNAKNYGVPQNRERVFMLSVRKDLDLPDYTFPEGYPLDKSVAELLNDEVDDSYFLRGDTVIKFLQKNETSNDADIIYVETEHFLSMEEIASIKIKHKHEEVYHTQGTD